MRNYRFFTTADVVKSDSAYDYDESRRKVLAKAASPEEKEISQSLVRVNSWLPQASKVYEISSNLNDYVIVPTVIFLSDLPNRNGVAFPLKELIEFNPDFGCLGYQTWVGKPTFMEHKNDILKEAKGVIFDTVMKPAPEYEGDLYKVINLLGFDKTKDRQLTNDILNRKRTCYSMGSYADDFECSICGKRLSKGGCEHANLNNPEFKVYDGKLAFLNTVGVNGFETSSVETPAFLTADNPNYIEMSKI